jgi:hypothetical protein
MNHESSYSARRRDRVAIEPLEVTPLAIAVNRARRSLPFQFITDARAL